MSTRLDAITTAYTLATGKTTLPATGTTKRDRLTALCTVAYEEIQQALEWDWLYEVVSAGTVTATDEFTLAEDVWKITTGDKHELNNVRITYDDQYVEFKLVAASALYRNRMNRVVARTADNKITFGAAFTADDAEFGGTIQVPAIRKLDALTTDADDILIGFNGQDAAWLPKRLSALYVRTDSQLNYLYDDLNDEATAYFLGMVDRNGTGTDSTSTGVDYFATMGSVGVSE